MTQLPEKLISPAEAGERLGVKPGTVRTWIKLGKIRHYSVGGGLNKLSESDLAAFVEERPAKRSKPRESK